MPGAARYTRLNTILKSDREIWQACRCGRKGAITVAWLRLTIHPLLYSEFRHPRAQRARVKSQNPRRAFRSFDPPVGLLENGEDVLALHLFEGLPRRSQLDHLRPAELMGQAQGGVFGIDHGPLDDVGQFPDVPRPRIVL